MLGTTPSLCYDPNMNARLGYKYPKRLKKAIKEQPKMHNSKNLKYLEIKVNLPDSEETLKDAEKSRLKMKDIMIPLDYPKLNKLYESFVPQKEIYDEQTYLSPPSTSNVSPESSPQIASSSSVSRPESKDNNLKKRVLLHIKSKSTSKNFKKSQRIVSLVSNKHDTLNSNVSE
ncbi:hypothetical protein Tco_0001631 [Tanacetum coccineum]